MTAIASRQKAEPIRSLYRVNYYVRGQVKTEFVCAPTGNEASAFLGVRDGSAVASALASPVEVVGVDPVHDALPVNAVTMAEPPPPRQFSNEEMVLIRKMLAKK